MKAEGSKAQPKRGSKACRPLVGLAVGSALLLSAPSSLFAKGSLDLAAGLFSLTAKSAGKTGSLSGPAVYSGSYNYPFLQNLEGVLGYSVFVVNGFGGDMGFGVDIGARYFPWSSASAVTASSKQASLRLTEQWRPYGGFAFHQRQFQSVSTSYAGFGFSVGTKYLYSERLQLKFEFRSLGLIGPSSATATKSDVLFGFVIDL